MPIYAQRIDWRRGNSADGLARKNMPTLRFAIPKEVFFPPRFL